MHSQDVEINTSKNSKVENKPRQNSETELISRLCKDVFCNTVSKYECQTSRLTSRQGQD